jgi:hypothetical protein
LPLVVVLTSRAIVTCEVPRTGAFGNTIVTDLIRTCFADADFDPVELPRDRAVLGRVV